MHRYLLPFVTLLLLLSLWRNIPIWRQLWFPVEILALGTRALFHSLFPFIDNSAGTFWIITASRTCLFVGSFRDRFSIVISNFCFSPPCFARQCFHSTELSYFFLYSSVCLLPLVYPFFPVSPLYSPPHCSSGLPVRFPRQLIRYVTPLSLHPPGLDP